MRSAAHCNEPILRDLISGFDFATTEVSSTTFVSHQHMKAELLLTHSGAIICEISEKLWLVPAKCAIWIPSNVHHRIQGLGDVKVSVIYVDPNVLIRPLPSCRSIVTTPFLRAVIQRIAAIDDAYIEDSPDGRVARILLDELADASAGIPHLPLPTNDRALLIAHSFIEDPSTRVTVAELAIRTGLAERTIARLFREETGMSFGQWRQQLHITIALQRLMNGALVQDVSLDLGYESASAFITMFRRILGKSPLRYVDTFRSNN